jgi:magnesium chelatase family protein
MIRRYRQAASGLLMDRIDLHVKPSRPSPEALLSTAPTEKSSAQLRGRVTVTLERQLSRQGCLNRDLAGNDIVEVCGLSNAMRAELIEALTALNVSARNAHWRLRVARTLADMAGEKRVSMLQINTALFFREEPTRVGVW